MAQYLAPESLCVIGYKEGVLWFSRETGARGGNTDEVQAWRVNSVQESGLAVEDFDKSEIQRAGLQATESEKSCVTVPVHGSTETEFLSHELSQSCP